MSADAYVPTPDASVRVECDCGALYRRSERRVTFRDNDAFSCRECGAVLAEWNGPTIPEFVRVA